MKLPSFFAFAASLAIAANQAQALHMPDELWLDFNPCTTSPIQTNKAEAMKNGWIKDGFTKFYDHVEYPGIHLKFRGYRLAEILIEAVMPDDPNLADYGHIVDTGDDHYPSGYLLEFGHTKNDGVQMMVNGKQVPAHVSGANREGWEEGACNQVMGGTHYFDRTDKFVNFTPIYNKEGGASGNLRGVSLVSGTDATKDFSQFDLNGMAVPAITGCFPNTGLDPECTKALVNPETLVHAVHVLFFQPGTQFGTCNAECKFPPSPPPPPPEQLPAICAAQAMAAETEIPPFYVCDKNHNVLSPNDPSCDPFCSYY